MGNWRQAFKSDFLASWDLDKSVILTIKNVETKMVQLQKSELKVVANFVEAKFENGEEVKSMILNSSNCKILNLHTKSKDTDNWNNLKVEIGVKANKGRIGGEFGLAILRVLNSGESISETKSDLKPGDANWDKVVSYVKSNKQLGLSVIVKNLEGKYTIDTLTKKELSNYIS